jgi:hypothetical protein
MMRGARGHRAFELGVQAVDVGRVELLQQFLPERPHNVATQQLAVTLQRAAADGLLLATRGADGSIVRSIARP